MKRDFKDAVIFYEKELDEFCKKVKSGEIDRIDDLVPRPKRRFDMSDLCNNAKCENYTLNSLSNCGSTIQYKNIRDCRIFYNVNDKIKEEKLDNPLRVAFEVTESLDDEMRAMEIVIKLLGEFDHTTQHRILDYFKSRFNVSEMVITMSEE